jgi:hypothetical protein
LLMCFLSEFDFWTLFFRFISHDELINFIHRTRSISLIICFLCARRTQHTSSFHAKETERDNNINNNTQ